MAYESYEDEYMEQCPDGRCKHCPFAHVVTAWGQWQFVGCYHEPYKGRWVAEIKDCPKNEDK